MILKTRSKEPEVGDTREVYYFAFFPAWVEDKLIWWERYCSHQILSTSTIYEADYAIEGDPYWKEIKRTLNKEHI